MAAVALWHCGSSGTVAAVAAMVKLEAAPTISNRDVISGDDLTMTKVSSLKLPPFHVSRQVHTHMLLSNSSNIAMHSPIS